MTGRGSAPSLLMHDKAESLLPEKRDCMPEIDDYFENITENFAAYTKESAHRKLSLASSDPRKLSNLKSFGSSVAPIDGTNTSFSEDGVVPSQEEGDRLFKPPKPEDADFTDPQFTDKSLSDIGFNYDYNKYLSKSRNFVNHRNRPANQVHNVHPDITPVSPEMFSPNRTLQDESDNALDSTLLSSPKASHRSSYSSPYSSDSSMEKENLGKCMPQSNLKHVQKSSRHTLTHSPITTPTEDMFLSTVDTDGKMVRHSTAKTTGIEVNTTGNLSRVINLGTQSIGPNVPPAEEITFV